MSNYKGNQKSKVTSKGSRRPKKGNGKPKLDRFDKETATNNPAWYSQDAALLRDAASIPFSWPVGGPINLSNPALTTGGINQTFSIPGICAVRTVPAIGRADSPADPINVAAFRMYSFIRHANSGSKNYDAPDMMLYLMAMSQVYSYINYLQRIYGVVNVYSQKNRYLPHALLTAMNADYDDIRNNMAAFRYGINVLINKAAALCVPNVMPIFQRYASMYQNIYLDGNSIKSQLYLYTPAGFWWYKLNPNQDYSGMLEYTDLGLNTNRTVDELLDLGHSMLDRLIQSEDMNIMSGDILKAYGQNSLIKLTTLPVDYSILPVTDYAVLNQIKNATAVPIEVATLNVVQDATKGWLEFKPTICIASDGSWMGKASTFALQSYCEDRILSSMSVDPTPEEIMESTRCTIICDNFVRSDDHLVARCDLHPGSEIVGQIIYYYYDFPESDLTPVLRLEGQLYFNLIDASDTNAVMENVKCTTIRQHFKFHPAVRHMGARPGSAEGTFNISDAFYEMDVDNYAILNFNVLKRMHETAILSQLNVPQLNKV